MQRKQNPGFRAQRPIYLPAFAKTYLNIIHIPLINDRMNIEFPVIQCHQKYFIGGVAEKDFAIAGELNMAKECYKGVRFIDSSGQEWKVNTAKTVGYISFWQYLQPRKYRTVKVEFDLEEGQKYDLSTLKKELEEFIFKHRLLGSPFLNKKKEVPEWLAKFKSIKQLTEYKMYLDW